MRTEEEEEGERNEPRNSILFSFLFSLFFNPLFSFFRGFLLPPAPATSTQLAPGGVGIFLFNLLFSFFRGFHLPPVPATSTQLAPHGVGMRSSQFPRVFCFDSTLIQAASFSCFTRSSPAAEHASPVPSASRLNAENFPSTITAE